jgi:hypothetical protein
MADGVVKGVIASAVRRSLSILSSYRSGAVWLGTNTDIEDPHRRKPFWPARIAFWRCSPRTVMSVCRGV